VSTDWQEQLDREGRVEFRDHPLWPVLFLVADVVALVWLFRVIGIHGLGAGPVVALLVVMPMTLGSAWMLASGSSPWLAVVRQGVEITQTRVIPFDRITAIEVQGERMTILHDTPGAKPGKDGVARDLVLGRKSPIFQKDLAVWLLRLSSTPRADIVETKKSLTTRVLTVRPPLS
jgi:hypothetical protein